MNIHEVLRGKGSVTRQEGPAAAAGERRRVAGRPHRPPAAGEGDWRPTFAVQGALRTLGPNVKEVR